MMVASSCIAMMSFAQQFTQNIRGVVVDNLSHEPIPYATIQMTDDPSQGCMADSVGQFNLCCIPVGRHSLRVSYVGYEPVELNDLLVTSAKETVVEIEMQEDAKALDEVEVRPRLVKEKTLNRFVVAGGRMFSIEEASRYAGGFDDPARLASSFAGVASGGATNGISIHGNAPHLLAWRLEDIEIPNPNHFSDISVLGGGIFSSLSAMVIGNSDFMTCAFPAEYGNAVSGVFDMKMRNGNAKEYEHTFQIGVAGIDVASEGPLSKKNGSSYLVNYRYSMTGLASKLNMIDMQGQVMDYQDLNFKINLPTRKAGTFSIWGTGLIDHFHNESVPNEWKSKGDETYSSSDQYMGAMGVGHLLSMKRGQLKSSIGVNYSRDEMGSETYNLPDGFDFSATSTDGLTRSPYFDGTRSYTNIVARTTYTARFKPDWVSQYGASLTAMLFDMDMSNAPLANSPLITLCKTDGSTLLLSAYTTHSYRFCDRTTLTAGLNVQHLALNGATTLEPRASVSTKLNDKMTLALAYGLHSRAEKTDIYFMREMEDPSVTGNWENPKHSDKLVNHDLGFTKSHHMMLTWGYKMSDSWNLKLEPYYQYLFDVPVEKGTPYSVLNRQEFGIIKQLVNDGEGRNYGVDVTLERFFKAGWYGMANGSFFSSKYKGGDGVWHHTVFDRNFIVNVMGGKEWMLGRNHNNMLSVNVRVTLQGGDRYSPLDKEATLACPDYYTQYDLTRAYSLQRPPMVIAHYTISYRMNRKTVTHEFSIKHINCTGTKSFYGYSYDYHNDKFVEEYFNLSLPNVSYKIEF